MAETNSRVNTGSGLGFFCTVLFIIVKGWGTAFAAWSWWWVFFSCVPVVWVFAERVGLL